MTDDDTELALEHLKAFTAAVGPLGRLRALRQAFDLYAAENVAETRAQGATWAEIADALGTSRQRAARVYQNTELQA